MENKLFDFIEKYMTLSAEEKQVIVELALFKTFRKGTVLLKEGDFSNESYFVLKGCIRCYYLIGGEEKTTAFYTESDTLSPICVVTKTASEHYISCVEDSLIVISNPYIEKIGFEKFPRFETLCRLISEEKLVKNVAAFDAFKNASPEQRYLNLINTRPDLVQRVPQHQLASYLGITPESLSRVRNRLAKQSKS